MAPHRLPDCSLPLVTGPLLVGARSWEEKLDMSRGNWGQTESTRTNCNLHLSLTTSNSEEWHRWPAQTTVLCHGPVNPGLKKAEADPTGGEALGPSAPRANTLSQQALGPHRPPSARQPVASLPTHKFHADPSERPSPGTTQVRKFGDLWFNLAMLSHYKIPTGELPLGWELYNMLKSEWEVRKQVTAVVAHFSACGHRRESQKVFPKPAQSHSFPCLSQTCWVDI